MDEIILGLDLGSNSIGWAKRKTTLDNNQIEKYGVITFQKGIGEGKSGEFSFAAERTKNRSVRRLYQARKYRLLATLKVLVENDYCPLPIEDLNKWKIYDKKKGLFRKYPIENKAFAAWINLDFTGNGKPEYSSPYQLRKELIEKKLNLQKPADRYKVGRALYHIAQRRGFKSSRKSGDKENTSVYNGSKESGARGVNEILKHIETYGTLGAALAYVETTGERVRNQYTLRRHYQDEVNKIFQAQEISTGSDFYKNAFSSIFFQRPLRSQKGLVGKCTLEPGKHRCPLSHPMFEEFRAWSFINNIRFKSSNGNQEKEDKLSLELREAIYREKFFRKSKDFFPFSDIRELVEKKGYKRELNYNDRTTVSGCPASARFNEIFGDNWKTISIEKEINKNSKTQNTKYTLEDIWHVLFSFDDEELVIDFAKQKLKFDDDQTKQFLSAWKALPDGYSMLSLHAIKKIVPFLREGFIYTEAVLLANMSEILGEEIWQEGKMLLTSSIADLISQNRKEKQLCSIVNNLIQNYHALDFKDKFAYKDFSYNLDASDKNQVIETIKETYGEKAWTKLDEAERQSIIQKVTESYQAFFHDEKRSHLKLPHLLDTIKQFLRNNFKFLQCQDPNRVDDNPCNCSSCKQLNKLYHPSQIETYPRAKPDEKGNILLQSPKTGAFKNPMAMRTLHELRKLINHLLHTGEIDSDTRIVIEIARELNDSNMRWAIETYQRRREEENQEFAIAIAELLKEHPQLKADPSNLADADKFRLWFEQLSQKQIFKRAPAKNKVDKDGNEIENKDPRKFDWSNIRNEVIEKVIAEKDLIKKYRLWKEQGCTCMYTGNIINLTDLFGDNIVDFEHTLPRSISFDNSLANLTVCYADYNRSVKKNRIPVVLENYENDWKEYTAIKPRLKDWEEKVEVLRGNIEFWRKKSKMAPNKEEKDYAIRQKHLWHFEFQYWRNKLERFTIPEVKSSFKNSQLVDTQIISKYAFHYLKTVFNRVDVQKGSVTAEFRKIYGIQPKNEKKDRSKHSHHAIDAAVLTLIPSAAKRDEILKKSFEYNEITRAQFHQVPYARFNMNHVIDIESNILINNIVKDQALTPAKKIVRRRGKIVYLRDKQNKLILDEAGKPKPKIAQGDSIRGQLHLDSFYGKIKLVARDEDGKPKRDENRQFIYEEKNDGFRFVLRKPVANISRLEEIVDPHVRKIIEQQLNGRSLEKAFSEGVYMLNKKGESVNKIRHCRCFTDVTDPLAIKKQTYLSRHAHKQDYYAANATNYLFALYQGEVSGKLQRAFELINLFEVSKLKQTYEIMNRNELPLELYKVINKKGDAIPLYVKLFVGQRVLFFKDSMNELRDLEHTDLLKRLYRIYKFEKDGRVNFQFHLDARNDKQLSELIAEKGKSIVTGFSKVNWENPWPRLKLSKDNFNFIIEKKHFEIEYDGTIKFL